MSKSNKKTIQSKLLKQISEFDRKNFSNYFKALSILHTPNIENKDKEYRLMLMKKIRDGYYTFSPNAKGKKFGFFKSLIYAQLFKYLHRQIHFNDYLKTALELHENDIANLSKLITQLNSKFDLQHREVIRLRNRTDGVQKEIFEVLEEADGVQEDIEKLESQEQILVDVQNSIIENTARLNAISEFHKQEMIGKKIKLSPANQIFFSQFGEDHWIANNIKLPKHGYFIDVGAADGITFSNTYYFEKHRWSGICFEPNPENYELAKRVRKNVRKQAVSSVEGKQKFLISPDSADWSKLVGETSGLESSDIIEVDTISMSSFLKSQKINHIDILSIDTEGTEIDVLNSIDFSVTQPSVIIVEYLNEGKSAKKSLLKFFKLLPYKLVFSTKSNLIFKYVEK